MSEPSRQYVAALAAELARIGITRYEIRTGRGHPRLCYSLHGRERFIVFPASPSDSARGVQQAVAFLRRQLGIKAPERGKSGRPAKQRAGDRAVDIRGTLDARPDPWAALGRLRAMPAIR